MQIKLFCAAPNNYCEINRGHIPLCFPTHQMQWDGIAISLPPWRLTTMTMTMTTLWHHIVIDAATEPRTNPNTSRATTGCHVSPTPPPNKLASQHYRIHLDRDYLNNVLYISSSPQAVGWDATYPVRRLWKIRTPANRST